MKRYDVVGAVIIENGFVLCAQRGSNGLLGGLWEFPGGKIEPGETPREALVREIAEELGIPASTARGLLARARKCMIVRMEEWR